MAEGDPPLHFNSFLIQQFIVFPTIRKRKGNPSKQQCPGLDKAEYILYAHPKSGPFPVPGGAQIYVAIYGRSKPGGVLCLGKFEYHKFDINAVTLLERLR